MTLPLLHEMQPLLTRRSPLQVERDDYKRMMAKYVGHLDISVKSELGDKAESEMGGDAPTEKKAGISHYLSQYWGTSLIRTPPS